MASTLQITINATDYASPVFKRVSENSKILGSQLGQQGKQGGQNFGQGFNAGVGPSMKQAQDSVKGAAKGMSDAMKQSAKQQTESIDWVQKLTNDAYAKMEKSSSDMSKNVQQDSEVAARKIITNNKKASRESRKSFEEMTDAAIKAFNKIQDEAAKDAVLKGVFDSGEAIAELEVFKTLAETMPDAVVKASVKGAGRAATELKHLDHQALEMSSRGVVMNITERGARRVSKNLLGLSTQSLALDAKMVGVDVAVRGAKTAAAHLWDLYVSKERLGGEPSKIQVLLKGLEGVMSGFAKIDEEGRDLEAERVKIKTEVNNLSALLNLDYLKDYINNMVKDIIFKTEVDDDEDVVGKTQDINDDANDISQHTIKFLTTIINNGRNIIERVKEINRDVNNPPNMVEFLAAVTGDTKVGEIFQTLRDQKEDLTDKPAHVRFTENGATETMSKTNNLNEELAELHKEHYVRFFAKDRNVSPTIDKISHKIADLVTDPATISISAVGAYMAIRKMDSVKDAAEAVGLTPAEVSLSVVGVGGVLAGVHSVFRAAKRVARDYKINTVYKDNGTPEKLEELRRKLIEVDGIDPEVAADMVGQAEVLTPLQGIIDRVRNINKTKLTVMAGILGSGLVIDRLTYIKRAGEYVNNLEVQPEVSIGNFFQSITQLKIIDKLADRLDNRRIRMSIDAKGAIILPKLLGDSLAILAHFETLGAAVHAVMVPALIAGIGALGAVFATLGSAIASAAGELAPGLVGALGTVGVGLGAGAAAILGYGFALNSTIKYSANLTDALRNQHYAIRNSKENIKDAESYLATFTEGTKEYENAAKSVTLAEQQHTQEIEKFGVMLSSVGPKTIDLGNKMHDLEMEFIQLGGAVREEIAPYMSRWIDIAVSKMDNLRKNLVGFISEMNQAADAAIKMMLSGQTWESIVSLLNTIRSVGPPAFTMTMHALSALFNVLQVAGPAAERFVKSLRDISVASNEWTRSAKGQERISEIWAVMEADMLQLWQTTKNISVGLGQVFSSLMGANLAGNLLNDLEGISEKFRRITAAGTESRSKLDGFFASMRPILSALGGLFGTIVSESARVVYSITTMGQGSSQLNPLVSILQHTENAIRYIANLIIHNFASLGPRMGPLIENLAKLAEVFLRSVPPLELFIDVFNKFMGVFTEMPMNQQRAIASTISWGIALTMVAAGPLAMMIRMVGKTATMMAGPIVVAGRALGLALGAVGKAGTFLLYSIYPLAGKLAGLGAISAVLTTPLWGIVGTVAAVVAIFTALIFAGGRLSGYLNGDGKGSFSTFGDAANAVKEGLISGILTPAKNVVSWFKSNWNQISEILRLSGQAIISIFGPVMAVLYEKINAGVLKIQAIFGKMFSNIGGGEGATAALDSIQRILGKIISWADANMPSVAQSIGGVFNEIGKIISMVASTVGPAVGSLLVSIGGFVTKIVSLIASAVSSLNGTLGPTLVDIGQTIGGLAGRVLPVFIGVWTDVFNGFSAAMPIIKPLAQIIGMLLKGAFDSLWPVVKIVALVLGAVFLGAITGAGKAVLGLGKVLGWLGTNVIQPLLPVLKPLAYIIGYVFATAVAGAAGFVGKLAAGIAVKLMPQLVKLGPLITKLSPVFMAFWKIIKWVWSGLRAAGAGLAFLAARAVGLGKVVSGLIGPIRQGFNVGPIRAFATVARGLIGRFTGWIGQQFNKLPGFIQKPLRAIGNLFGPAIKIWTAVFKRNFAIISTTVKRGMAIVRTVIKMVMAGVKMVFSGALKIILGIFTGNFKKIVLGTKIFSRGITIITKALGGGLKALWRLAWAAIKNIWNTTLKGLRAVASSWGAKTKGVFSAVDKFLRNLWDKFWSFLRGLFDRTLGSLYRRADKWVKNTRKMYANFKSWLADLWTKTWKRVWEILDNALSSVWRRIDKWWKNTKSLLQTAYDGVKGIFQRIGEAIWNPIKKAGEKLKGVWNGILDSVANVLEKVKLTKLAGTVRSAKMAKGGVLDKSGPRAMARGGVVSQDSVGGVANGIVPRVVYGEAKKPETYAVHGEMRSMPYAQEYLDSVGYNAMPKEYGRGGGPAPEIKHQRTSTGAPWVPPANPQHGGGAGYPPINFTPTRNWNNEAYGFVKQVEAKYPNNFVNTYQGHGQFPGGEAQSWDVWGPGQGSITNTPDTANSVFDYTQKLIGDRMKYMIYKGSLFNGAGQSAYTGYGGQHFDHLHTSIVGSGESGTSRGGILGALGNAIKNIPNPLQILLDKLWKPIKGSVDGFNDNMQEGMILKAGVGKLAQNSERGLYKMIDDKIPDTIGGGGGSGGVSGNFSGSQKDVALEFAKNAVGRGMPGRLPVMTALQESGMRNLDYGHGSSLGYFQQTDNGAWGTPSDRMDPAKSLGMFLDAAQGFKGQYSNTAGGLGAWAQAVQASAYPDAYTKHWDTAASLIGDKKYYAKGGITDGSSSRLTMEPVVRKAFTRVANTLNGLASSGGLSGVAGIAFGDSGGVGTGRRPIAITNEAGPESIIPLSRKTPQGDDALREAIRVHGIPETAEGFGISRTRPNTDRSAFDTMSDAYVSRGRAKVARQRNAAANRGHEAPITINMGGVTINDADKKTADQIMEEIGVEVEKRVKKAVREAENKGRRFSSSISRGDNLG